MSIFGTTDAKSSATTTSQQTNITAKSDTKKELKTEIKDYSNKGNEYINDNLSSIVELFDRANKKYNHS
jgi:hypothetical protein